MNPCPTSSTNWPDVAGLAIWVGALAVLAGFCFWAWMKHRYEEGDDD